MLSGSGLSSGKSVDSENEMESTQLEGDIIIPGFSSDTETSGGEYNTLDEPILSTIVSTGKRDYTSHFKNTCYCYEILCWFF